MPQCPAGGCKLWYTQDNKLRLHILQEKDDPAHALCAQDLNRLNCAVCGEEFETATRRKQHERSLTCSRYQAATSMSSQALVHQSYIEAIPQPCGLTKGALNSVGIDVPSNSTWNTALITAVPKVEDGVSPPTLEISNGVDGSSRPPLLSESPSSDELVPMTPTPGFVAPQDASPPQALLVPENLFHNIKVYFENSCRNMILDDHGTLLTPNGAKLHNNLCTDFDSYCFTATMLIEKGLHIEFRRALSKATALVGQILRAEHPRTLACFLEVFIHLIQTRLPGITSFLRDFIKRMSAIVTRKGHPWGQICRLLGELDSESLEETMVQTWKCTTDTFDSELGKFSPLAVSVRLDYVKRVYGIANYREEERLLRDLLAQFGGIPRLSTPRVMLNLAHNLNKQGRHDEAEKMALEVLSLLQCEIYARRIVERIETLKIVSRSQFNQGKTLAAEQTMRKAIRMIMDQWGRQHSWVPEFINVLEGWLRGWGREEDANTLRGEIEELMGKDEIAEP